MKKERIARLVSARKLGGALLSLLMLVGLASCGKGDPNTLTLEVKPELRELGNFMSIESKEAVITLNEFTDDGEPRIRISSTLQVKVSEDVASDYGFDLEVVILDKNMNELTPFGDYDIEYVTDYDTDTYHYILNSGDHRAVMNETGSKESWEGKGTAMWTMMRTMGKYMALKPRWNSAKFVPYKGTVSAKSSSEAKEIAEAAEVEEVEPIVVGTDSEDWDEILDEYESYCTKLATYAKKVKAGDISAAAEYASILESAQSLQEKLDDASSELSAAQAARLAKIAAKMASAM